VRELRSYEPLENLTSTQHIDLVIESTGRAINYRIELVFAKVPGLKLEGFGAGEFRITGQHISDGSDRQWHGVWEVSDVEDNVVEFRSFSTAIVSVDPVQSSRGSLLRCPVRLSGARFVAPISVSA
jgi:hypothetical protein